MKLEVKRFSESKESTLGLLFINNVFACFTIEDQSQEKKVMSETRIPEGTYTVKLRKEGGMHVKYVEKFKEAHKGMLHVTNVPGFEWILIHIGNNEKNSAGCLLLVDEITNNKQSEIGGQLSTQAYLRVYSIVSSAIEKGEVVTITYETIEKGGKLISSSQVK